MSLWIYGKKGGIIINDLKEVEKIAVALIKNSGLKGWRFEYSNAKALAGCAGILNGKKIIRLSKFYALHQPNINALRNTILHEIAHALDIEKRGYTNHDKTWKAIAKSVGCDGKAKKTEPDLKISRKELCKWIATCPNCKSYHYAHRRLKHCCRNCCDKYNNGKPSSKFLFEYSINPDMMKIEEPLS